MFWPRDSQVEACGLSCLEAHGILVLRPRKPGMEPASPALEGGFLTTDQRKSPWVVLFSEKGNSRGRV